jgi:hypothetical protein
MAAMLFVDENEPAKAMCVSCNCNSIVSNIFEASGSPLL